LNLVVVGLRELGVGVRLMAIAGRGVVLDVAERDDLAQARLANAMRALVWRPLPTLDAAGHVDGAHRRTRARRRF
jgi:hypothetical protein